MSLDNIFEFVSVRPAQRAQSQEVERRFARYSATAESPLHQQIEELEGEDRRDQAVQLAREYMDSESYVDEADPIIAAATQASQGETVGEAKQKAAAALGVDHLAAYLESDEFETLRDRLWDSLYAQTLAPHEKPDDRNAIYAAVRAAHYLSLLLQYKNEEAPPPPGGSQAIAITVPPTLIPQAGPPPQNEEEIEIIETVQERLKELHTRVQARQVAIDDLRNTDRLYRGQKLRTYPTAEVNLDSNDALELHIPKETLDEAVLRVSPRFVDVIIEPVRSAATKEVESFPAARSLIMPPEKPWVFESFGQEHLKETTRAVLQEREAALAEEEATEIISRLEAEMTRETVAFIEALPQRAIPYVVEQPEFREIAQAVDVPLTPVLPAKADPFPAPGSPAARGIRPLGVGDLLVVQQELLRYAPGEVAHIENVLRSEHKTRTHTRVQETEDILVVETEEVEESEHDLQSTERFELQKETERTIESQLSAQAGLSVTASYGVVSATATANFAYNQSRSESQRTASQFAKEVVERSVSRIKKRVREERTRRTLERVEEVNEHGFDNRDGDGHVIGVYRWVDKYYKARTVNYGRRLMMEFIVPEPAAFYIDAQSRQPLEGVTAKRPEEPKVWGQRLRPEHLTAHNYHRFVSEYNVQDVKPYPTETTKVSAAFAEATNPGEAGNVDYSKVSETLVIPADYTTSSIYGQYWLQGYEGYFATVLVAGEPWPSISTAGLEGKIPVSITGWLSAFAINLVARCRLKDEARVAWQLETFQAIMNAYEQALAEYNEQIAAAEIGAGVVIAGRNPEMNRKIERAEVQKSALRLLTDEYARTRVGGNWRFNEAFDAMKATGAYGNPEFDVDEALVEGQIIQFFEQAFEWQNMTYRFYPYFWGRKENWRERILIDDTDPQFAAFLRAGAARVVVPVHPAYTEAVLHYLHTSEIWNGDHPPTLDDPLYISIVDELKADSGADPNEPLPACSEESGYPCVVDEWEVKIPTNLVYLQPDPELPELSKEGYMYIVQHGDSWYLLEQKTGVSVEELQEANPQAIHPNLWLYVGEKLFIPAPQP